jgi:hypothetical protein
MEFYIKLLIRSGAISAGTLYQKKKQMGGSTGSKKSDVD